MSELEQKTSKNTPAETFLEEKFRSLGFEQLTDIQKKASPKILEKKDSLIIAPTGSGKTECTVIPIFSLVKKTKQQGKIKVLYVTPLRALNRDVFRRIIKYAEFEDLTIQIRHGDTSQSLRKKISESPPDILITTPETLVILLTQKKMLAALSELEWAVIDEVHELLASERGSQLSLSLERLQLNSNQKITRVGLSATVGNIEEAGQFLVGTNRPCKIIQDKSIRKYDVEVKFVKGSISEVADSIIEYETTQCCQAERLFLAHLEGGCSTAIGCWGRMENRRFLITGYAAAGNGSKVLRKSLKGMPADSNQLALQLAEEFEQAGVRELLAG